MENKNDVILTEEEYYEIKSEVYRLKKDVRKIYERTKNIFSILDDVFGEIDNRNKIIERSSFESIGKELDRLENSLNLY